jgi:hypothetical protein
VIEDADQREQRRIGRRLVPVIENDVERLLAPDGTDDGAEDDGHQQQCGEASVEADCAVGGKNNQDAGSQEEANQHLS